MDLFRTKSIEQSIADTDEPEYQLKKSLSALDLTVFGVGVVIGAGIFTLTGRAAHNVAGPSIVISFVVAALACALAAMCYAEFASTVPVSGSAYTFSYASLGEIFAWIIGWDLILEMFLGASVVAQGWSAYLGVFLSKIGITIPAEISYGGPVDLMAILLVLVLGVLVTVGIKESMRVNLVLVGLKLFIVLFVIVAGIMFINPANYSPFVPAVQATEATTGLTQPLIQFFSGAAPSAFGVGGIFAGAALVFFAYIGFDVVATTAEETKNPQRDLPIGIIASLTICTVLYCAVALVVTGMVRYDQLDPTAALANAFAYHGQSWMATLISAGAVAGLTTVVLTLMIGATRLIFAMCRDSLLPMGLARVHKKYRTPWLITIIVTIVVALVAGLTPIGVLEEMVNIGTLSAFVMVSIGIVVLRHKRPDLKRGFRVPWSPVLPIVSALICLYLMLNLSVETWLRFLVWLVIGFVIYFAYSRTHARLHTHKPIRRSMATAMEEGVIHSDADVPGARAHEHGRRDETELESGKDPSGRH
jgi:APA family basic amino acid/polyamine antiporter